MTSAPGRLVLIPSYNAGPRLLQTVTEALAVWSPVWVVVDGSTDGSDAALDGAAEPGLRVLKVVVNGGKGAAVLHGLRAAEAAGYTHVLTMDATGSTRPAVSRPSWRRRCRCPAP